MILIIRFMYVTLSWITSMALSYSKFLLASVISYGIEENRHEGQRKGQLELW